ncbi:MAG: ATP-dependent Clp protease proteolytic subunit [Ignavibacteria bacterium]
MTAQHSGQPAEKVMTDAERDNIMSPDEAKKYGLIDEILFHREKKEKK